MNKILLLLLIAIVSCKNLRDLAGYDFNTFYAELITKHNTLRAKHNSPALTKLDDIAKLAETTLDGCVKAGTLVHSGNTYKNQWLGQNLYVCGGTYPTADSVLNSWYTNEEKNYDYDKGTSKNGGVTGHFTQVVWKGSKQIGCAVTQGNWSGFKNSYYVCCNYFPGGNMAGAYTKNVDKPSS
jgi:uncharacterized protein YkwD